MTKKTFVDNIQSTIKNPIMVAMLTVIIAGGSWFATTLYANQVRLTTKVHGFTSAVESLKTEIREIKIYQERIDQRNIERLNRFDDRQVRMSQKLDILLRSLAVERNV